MRAVFASLSNPNYRIYWFGGLVSNTGTWMMRIAQDWLVLKPLDGGPIAVGIVTGLQFLPVLLFSPYAGVLADRFSKRTLMIWAQAIMATFALLQGVIAIAGASNILLVYLCAFGMGIGAAFDAPARQAMASELVGRERVQNAVALSAASFNVGRLLGPALAGLMISWLGSGQFSTGVVIVINGLSFLAVIAALLALDLSKLYRTERSAEGQRSFMAGLSYLRTSPSMLYVIVSVLFVGTFAMNFQVASALMATEVFHTGAGEFGLLGTFQAIGSLFGALLAASRRRVSIKLLFTAGIAVSLAVAAAGVAPTYWVFAAIAPMIGFTMVTLLNSSNAFLQLGSSPEYRGRILAVYHTVHLGTTAIGSPFIGWIGAVLGARWTLWVGGGLSLVGVLLSLALYLYLQRRVAPPDIPAVA